MAVKMDKNKGKVLQLVSERQRPLQTVTFEPSSTITERLPLDTTLKSLGLRLSGSITTTFGSGTPVADAFSIFDNLVSRIDIRVNGDRLVKSIRPWMIKMQNLMTDGVLPTRRSSAGASAATDNFPTVDQGFVYGTTTQITTCVEYLRIDFENSLAPIGKELTWLNLKNRSSAQIIFNTKAYSALLGFGNTAPVVYSASTLTIGMKTLEAQDVPEEMEFADWKQTHSEHLFSSTTTNRLIQLNRGNYLQGLMFLAREGQAGSSTTATGKLRSNILVTDLALKINGQTDVKSTTFQELQDENRAKYKINAPMASNVSTFDGMAYMDFLKNGDIRTAVPCISPIVDQVDLAVSTSANATYTNPASLDIMTNEIVWPQGFSM